MQHLKDLQLLENRLVIRKIVEPKGGIEIPEGTGTEAANHFRGLVVCVGPDCKQVKEGDHVIFRDGYSKLKLDEDEELFVTREDHIVGIIKAHA